MRPNALENVPAAHGIGALEPAGQKDPDEHGLQLRAPLCDWNVPAAHGVHVAWLIVAVKDPGEHVFGVMEPVGPIEPAGHDAHSLAAVRSPSPEYVPARHGSSAEAPVAQ